MKNKSFAFVALSMLIFGFLGCSRQKVGKTTKHGIFSVKHYKKSNGFTSSPSYYDEIYINKKKYRLPDYIKNNDFTLIHNVKYLKYEGEFALLFSIYNELAEQIGWHLLFVRDGKNTVKYLGETDGVLQTRFLKLENNCKIDAFTGELSKGEEADTADYQCVMPLFGMPHVVTYHSLKAAVKNPNEVYKLLIPIKKLKKLQAKIGDLKNLRILDLYANTELEIPAEFKNLKNLRLLNLKTCSLGAFPEEITHLTELEVLNISNNQLTTIPDDISKLVNLQALDLQQNKLSKLPDAISNLKKLKYLYLFQNNFSENEKQKIKKMLPDCEIYFSVPPRGKDVFGMHGNSRKYYFSILKSLKI